MNRVTIAVLGTFVVLLIGSGILAYVFRDTAATPVVTTTATPSGSPGAEDKSRSPAANQPQREPSLIGTLFGADTSGLSPSSIASLESTAARIALRFSLAAFLAALLAFRPRRGLPVIRPNPFVAQTQILMAVVAGGMMMVVGDSAARAFGIFAAAILTALSGSRKIARLTFINRSSVGLIECL